MYELKRVSDRTYYIDCPAKIGIHVINNDNDIYLIDTGNDDDAAKKVAKIIQDNNWNLKYIINSHSHADHIGGNNYLQKIFNVPIYCTEIENCFINYPILESSFLYGGTPCEELKNKFLCAKESETRNISEISNIKTICLKGHSPDMIGVITEDNIAFIGDSLSSKEIIEKYHICYIYDVEKYLKTLEYIKGLDVKLFVPSHAEPTKKIDELVEINILKVQEIIFNLTDICVDKKNFEQILKEIFEKYSLKMNITQYVLVGSTIKSYLTYMKNIHILDYEFVDNVMYWIKK